uniref:Osteocalcin 2-like n=1 Tax=Diabrotica virgifera virgifera TaxID=50390 RepID=A0A6P7HD61_DIAVI
NMSSRTSRIMQAALCSDRNEQNKEVENDCLEKIHLRKKPEEQLSSPYKKETGPNVENLNNSDSDMTKDLVGSESLCFNEIENDCREEIPFLDKQYLVNSEHVKENEEGLVFENLQNVNDSDVAEQNIESFHTNTQQNVTTDTHTEDLNSRCFDLEDCNSDDSIKDPDYDSDSSSASSSSSSLNSSSSNSSPRCTDSAANSTSRRLKLAEEYSASVIESEYNSGQSKDVEEKKAKKGFVKKQSG